MGYNRVILSRPYDAQIEYLEATGTQWIDTEIVSQNNLVYDFRLTETQENNQKTFFGFKEGETETWLVNGMNDVNWGGVDETGHWLYVDFAANHTRCALGYPDRNGVYHFDFTDGNASFTLNDTTVWTSALSGTYDGSRHVFIFWMDSVWNFPQNDQYDRKGIGRISYFQIRKNGNLLFDGIPVRKGNEGYIYDRVSGKLFGNQGTGSFILGNDIPNTAPTIRHVLYTRPYDSEVEYLESTGTQYINTGTMYDSDINIECKFAYTTNKNNNIVFRYAGSNKNFGVIYEQSSQKILVQRIDKGRNCSIAFNTDYHTVKNFQTFLQIDDVRQDISSTFSETSTASIQLFCQYNARVFGFLKLAYFKIYKGDTLVRDFIPVRKETIGYMYDKVSGKLFANQGTGNFILGNDVSNPVPKIRRVMPIRVVKEVHVTFGHFPFTDNVDEVVYTQDINRRSKSTQTPKNITYTGQSFQVWAWTENNEREKLTCFIGCEYFYPQYGSKLFVHSSVSSQNTNGIFRYIKVANLDFCKCWDATYITSLATAFKNTSITDFSGLQNWNLTNLTSMWEMASQLAGNRDFRPFLKMGIGDKVTNIASMFYGNTLKDTTDWSPMCSNYHWKLVSSTNTNTYLPYCNYLDMTNWDLTEWNMSNATPLFSHGAGALKIKTPILPLTVMPMKLPYTYYDMETEQAYTEIPLNLDRQLTLYKNKSDFGK